MSLDDPVVVHLDVIARLLESRGYAIEVDYVSATIIVWVENWPIVLEIKRQRAKGRKAAIPKTSA